MLTAGLTNDEVEEGRKAAQKLEEEAGGGGEEDDDYKQVCFV